MFSILIEMLSYNLTRKYMKIHDFLKFPTHNEIVNDQFAQIIGYYGRLQNITFAGNLNK